MAVSPIPATLLYLTYITVILLFGLLCTIISRKIRIPNVLLLLLIGIILNKVTYRGEALATFSPLFLTSIAIIALVMIVFDSAARFKFKEFDTLSLQALKLTIIFMFFNLIFLTVSAFFIIGFPLSLYYIFIAMIFAATMTGTDAGTVLSILKSGKSKLLDFLEVESILNTPFTVIIPFIIIGIIQGSDVEFSEFTIQAISLLRQIIVGVGAGVMIGIVIFKIMRKYYSEELSPLAIIVSALLTYILAENLGGNGVLAVTALGLIFGSIYIKQKPRLLDFSLIFSTSLEIFVFIIIGFVVAFPFTFDFFLRSIFLFIVYMLIRFLAVQATLFRQHTAKERLFMTLIMPKGITVAVIVFSLSIYDLAGLDQVLNYMLIFLLYSIIVASLVVKYSKLFIQTEVIKEKPTVKGKPISVGKEKEK